MILLLTHIVLSCFFIIFLMQVLRAYDNRVRPTPRTPNLYIKPGNVPNTKATTVFHMRLEASNGSVLPFGQECNPEPANELTNTMSNHLFDAGVQLQVISVPFQKGKHFCTSPKQAVSLIEDLERLHNANLVHGDIRAMNCVFHDQGSKLIDYDFGGTHGEVKYPKNYRTVLKDGKRVASAEQTGTTIYKWHDTYALVQLLLGFHLVSDVNDLHRECAALYKCAQEEKDEKGKHLLASLKKALHRDGCKIEPTPELEECVGKAASSMRGTLPGHEGTPVHRR